MRIMAIDVSGNWKEGKGTTGLCFMTNGEPLELKEIKADNYTSPEGYWAAHRHVIETEWPDLIICEGYKLYNHKGKQASMQANSELETPQLIGFIKMVCYDLKIPLVIQFASEIKTRWSESVLVHKGILEQRGSKYYFQDKSTSSHKRDALKHALHFWRYRVEDNRTNKQ